LLSEKTSGIQRLQYFTLTRKKIKLLLKTHISKDITNDLLGLKKIHFVMTVAVRGQGKTGGVVGFALNFLLTFSFKRKSKKSSLQEYEL
jgi:hypothetical protein